MATGFTYLLNNQYFPNAPLGLATGMTYYSMTGPSGMVNVYAPTGGNWINWNIYSNSVNPYTNGPTGTTTILGNMSITGSFNSTAIAIAASTSSQTQLIVSSSSNPITSVPTVGYTGGSSDKIIFSTGNATSFSVSIGATGSILYESASTISSYISGISIMTLSSTGYGIGPTITGGSTGTSIGYATLSTAQGLSIGTNASGYTTTSISFGVTGGYTGYIAMNGGYTGQSGVYTTVTGTSLTGAYVGGQSASSISIGYGAGYENDLLYNPITTTANVGTATFLNAIINGSNIVLPVYGTNRYLSSSTRGNTFVSTVSSISSPFTTMFQASPSLGTYYFALGLNSQPTYYNATGWSIISTGTTSATSFNGCTSSSFTTLLYTTGSISTLTTGSVYWSSNSTITNTPAFTALSVANGLPVNTGYWGACSMSAGTTSSNGYALVPYLSGIIVGTSISTLYMSPNIGIATGALPSFFLATGAPTLTYPSYWTVSSLSSSGQYAMACTNDGSIYVSSNGGIGASANTLVWTEVYTAGTIIFSASMSSSGQYMVVGTSSGIDVSYTFGNVWYATLLPATLVSVLSTTLSPDGFTLLITGTVSTLSTFQSSIYLYTLSTSTQTVSIGINAGVFNQGAASIAIGANAGQTAQSFNAIAVGTASGQIAQPTNAVAIGFNTGMDTDNAFYTSFRSSALTISTFSTQTPGISPNGQQIAVASTNMLYLSSNGGTSFSSITISSALATFSTALVSGYIASASAYAYLFFQSAVGSINYSVGGSTFNAVSSLFPLAVSSACSNTAFVNILFCSGNGTGTSGSVYWTYNANPAVIPLFSLLSSTNGSIFATTANYRQSAMSSTYTPSGGIAVLTYNNGSNVSQLIYSNTAHSSISVYPTSSLSFTPLTPTITNGLPTLTTPSSVYWNAVGVSGSGQYILAAVYGGAVYLSSNGGGIATSVTFTLLTALPVNSTWSTISVSGSGQYMMIANASTLYISSYYGLIWVPLTTTLSGSLPILSVDGSRIVYATTTRVVISYILTQMEIGNTVSVGKSAGMFDQGVNAVALGNNAGQFIQGKNAVVIGQNAGVNLQGTGAVAIGGNTAITAQGANAIAIGQGASTITQGSAAVAMGYQAGPVGQGANAVAIGPSTWTFTATGYTGLTGTQSASAVSIGANIGTLNQMTNAIQIGQNTGIATTFNSFTYTGATLNWINTILPSPIPSACTSSAMSGTGQFQAVLYNGTGYLAMTSNGNSATPVWFAAQGPLSGSPRSVLISNSGLIVIVYGNLSIFYSSNYGQSFTTISNPTVPAQPSGTTGVLGGWSTFIPLSVCASTATTTLGQMQYQLVITGSNYIYFTTTGSTAAGLATFCRIDGTNNLPASSSINSGVSPCNQYANAISANGQYGIFALYLTTGASNLYWTSNITSCTPPTSCPTWTLLASSGNVNGLPAYTTSSLYWYIVAMSGNGNYILAAGNVAGTTTASQVYLSSNAASGNTPTFVAVSGLPATIGWGAFTISSTGQYMYAYGANPSTNAVQTYVSSNFGVNWTLITSPLPFFSAISSSFYPLVSQDGQFTFFTVFTNGFQICNGSYLQQVTTNQSSQPKNAVAIGTNAGMQDVIGWQTTVLTNLTYGNNAMSSTGQYQIVTGNGRTSGYSITSNGNTPSPTWQYYSSMPGAFSNTEAAVSDSGQNMFLFTSVRDGTSYHSYSTNYGASFATCSTPVANANIFAAPITYTSTLSQILAPSQTTVANTNILYLITNAISLIPTYKNVTDGNYGIPVSTATFGVLPTTSKAWATSSTGQYTIGVIAVQSSGAINGASFLYWSSTLLSTIAATTSGAFFTSTTGGSSGLPNLITTSQYWTTVAISGNGQYILVCGFQTNLYLSVNGTTGSPTFTVTSVPSMIFKSAVISASGQYMYVSGINSSASGTNLLYYSNNYGSSWVSVNVPIQNNALYTSLSSDGQYMLISIDGNGTVCNGSLGNNVAIGANAGTINHGGQSVAIGTNAGQNNSPGFSIAIGNAAGLQTDILNSYGSAQTFTSSTITIGAAVSYNGQYITYVAYGTSPAGFINYSLNYGTTFTSISNSTSGLSVVMSSSGQNQMIFPWTGTVTSFYSTTYGQSWIAGPNISSLGQFYSAAASSTLQYIFPASSYNTLFYSSNGGVSFATTSITNANSVCTSFNGQFVFVSGGTGALSWYSSNGNNGIAANIIFTQFTAASGLPIGVQITRYCSMSGTGQYILVGSNSGPVYLSTTGGSSNIPVFTTIVSLPQLVAWGPNGMSYSGQYMAIFNTASPFAMYVSYTYGTTWVFLANTSNPGCVCISGDGTKLVTSSQLSTTNLIFSLQQNAAFNTVAIGTQTAFFNQGLNSIAIGYQAGATYQNAVASFGSIAIGYQAGILSQGYNAIAIGYQAGSYSATTGQPANTFMISTASVRSSGYGQVSSGALMYATNGELYYRSASKTFVIDHPTTPDAYLVHACLEGPEAGVYVRGEGVILSESVDITLPSYSDALATTYTIHVTGKVDRDDITIGTKSYRASRVTGGAFTVYGPPGAFFWHAYGKRGDIVTEPMKTDVTKHGDGPYSYLAAAAL